jgi:alpha-L-fucosidase
MRRCKPGIRQLEFQDWELGIFIHFGIRTFSEGHRDWDGKAMNPADFNPTQLDCGEWAKAASDAGAKYMVLTAKHHDGFANWPSKYTDFSVAATPWRGGHGDVLKDFTEACRGHGLKIGLYYSPADASSPKYSDSKAYDDYFIKQISEILTGYGQIDMLWFDGCGSEGHSYDWPRIVCEIRRMQEKILIFNMGGDPDYRWVGNESGLAPVPAWNTVDAVDFSVLTDKKETLKTKLWLPAECDLMMRDYNWFYSGSDEDTVKSVAELLGIYYYSVGRGCNMLLNIGPDRRGLFPEKDKENLLKFGAEIKRRFSEPVISFGQFKQEGNTWTYEVEDRKYFHLDHVVAEEDLRHGESVHRFRVSILPYCGGTNITVYEGQNIGHKAICQFPMVRARKVIIEILKSKGKVRMRKIEAFRTAC